MVRFGFCIPVIGILLMGCSTAKVTPDIATFGGSVEIIAKNDRKAARYRGLPDRVAAARRADLAAANAVYTVTNSEACSYTYPSLTVAPPRFKTACRLVPKNAQGQVIATEFNSIAKQEAADIVVPTRNRAVLREHLTLKIVRDLEQYAAALKVLADSNLPGDIGRSTSKAVGAAAGLSDTVRQVAAVQGTSAPSRQVLGSLLSIGAREAAEAARYRRLRKIVEYADPFVQKATVQLATMAYQREKGRLDPLATEFQEGLNDFDGGTEAGLARIEKAYSDLAEADRTARFRTYSNIGLGHRAIVQSLSKQASIKELTRANDRIDELSKSVKTLVAR